MASGLDLLTPVHALIVCLGLCSDIRINLLNTIQPPFVPIAANCQRTRMGILRLPHQPRSVFAIIQDILSVNQLRCARTNTCITMGSSTVN